MFCLLKLAALLSARIEDPPNHNQASLLVQHSCDGGIGARSVIASGPARVWRSLTLCVTCVQGSKVEGPVPAPDLAPSVPLAHAAAMAPAPTAPINPLNPVSLLVNVRPLCPFQPTFHCCALPTSCRAGERQEENAHLYTG